MTYKLFSVCNLPNKEGFKFIALMKDNSMVYKTVKKDGKGFYYVDGYKDIKGWFLYKG